MENAQQEINALIPVYVLTGRDQSGVNVVLLWPAAEERGFTSDRWLIYASSSRPGGRFTGGKPTRLITVTGQRKLKIAAAISGLMLTVSC